jgi:hypothetical protein
MRRLLLLCSSIFHQRRQVHHRSSGCRRGVHRGVGGGWGHAQQRRGERQSLSKRESGRKEETRSKGDMPIPSASTYLRGRCKHWCQQRRNPRSQPLPLAGQLQRDAVGGSPELRRPQSQSWSPEPVSVRDSTTPARCRRWQACRCSSRPLRCHRLRRRPCFRTQMRWRVAMVSQRYQRTHQLREWKRGHVATLRDVRCVSACDEQEGQGRATRAQMESSESFSEEIIMTKHYILVG